MRFIAKLLFLLTLVRAVSRVCWAAPLRPTHAQHAMVASVHELASRAGVEAMKAGGNAIDAAVATGFVLSVVHPQAGNLGGGGFMLIRMADGKTRFLDFREKAPAAATENMYLDPQGNVIEDMSLVGYKAIGVPGSVAGLAYAQKNYGKLPLAQVMAPAIKLARDGFVLAWEDAEDLKDKDLRSFRNRGAFSSATGTCSTLETFLNSRNSLALSSASPRIRTIFIMAIWLARLRPPSKKVAA